MDYKVIYATSLKGVRHVLSNPRVITGGVVIAGVGLIPYEGALERDFLEMCDFSRKFSYVGAQPLRLIFKEGGKRRYTPDFLCKYKVFSNRQQFSPILYEIKERKTLKEEWTQFLPGFRRAARLCRDRGWRFRIATERTIRCPQLARIKFLRGYLDLPSEDRTDNRLCDAIRELGASTPSRLLEMAFPDIERRLHAVGALWKLIALGRIHADLRAPFNMAMPIWSPHYDHRQIKHC